MHTNKARPQWRAGSIQQSLNGGLHMRTFDLTPFYRSTVGFDRLFSLLDQATDGSPGYPPYNIERTGENAYRITVAVSGFAESELSIVAKENTLTIKGDKVTSESGKEKSEVLYRGIAARAFERVFQLADFVIVKNASLENGLLHVDLVREIPEAKKPRSIPISTSAPETPVIEGSADKAAA
jgi:molecular chaperone IbpA